MPTVIAIQNFEHGGSRRIGDRFPVSDQHAAGLALRGLVSVETQRHPTTATGTPQSASPVAPVSPQTIAKPSALGAKRPGRQRKNAAS